MKWTKNLTYPDASFRQNIVPIIANDSTCPVDSMLELALLFLQEKKGVQIVVPLDETEKFMSFMPRFNFRDYPWPARSFELFFESPELPTVLSATMNGDGLGKMGFKMPDNSGIDPLEHNTHILLQEKDGERFTLQSHYTVESMEELLLARGERDKISAVHKNDESLDNNDSYMLGLAAAMVYKAVACCGEGVTKSIKSRKEMRHGGKSGVLNRPKTPSFFIYTP